MKFTYLILSILLFSQKINSQNSFTAKLDVPQEIIQGEYTEIILNIYKPQGARNYTIFTQKLPTGFFVKMIDAKGASYTYENSTLALTWLRCPPENKFSVKYEIASMQGISGNFNIGGKLTYIVGSQQATYDAKKKNFSLVKTKPEDKKKNKLVLKHKVRYTNTKLDGVTCKRKITYNKNKNYYIVELNLASNKKGSYSIIESIPKGFEFSEIESEGATLRKKMTLIQYMWKKLPNNNLKIKYKLVASSEKNKNPHIIGKLSFLSNGKISNLTITDEDEK